MKNVLVIGSTGMIGSRIADEAKNRGYEVTGATRSGGEGRIALDSSDAKAVATAAAGKDAIVVAIAPPRDGSETTGPLLATGRGVLEAARTSGVKRVFVVGGAGSLKVPDGSQVVDQPWFPAEVKPEALAHGALLELLRDEADDLEWSYLSPAGQIAPGDRTGSFTLGKDDLLADSEGNSAISAEDFAVAAVDELEKGEHIRQRFTLAYT